MPGYMECSCYNVLGGSLKVGDTDGYPLVWCIGRQLSLDMMTLLLARYQYLLEQLTSSINKIREELGHETATDSVQHLLSRVEILSHKEETLLTKKRNKKLKSLGVPETSNIGACEPSVSGLSAFFFLWRCYV